VAAPAAGERYAASKGAIFTAMDRDTGDVVWERVLGPSSTLGGVMTSLATDGERVFLANTNWVVFGFFGGIRHPLDNSTVMAIDPATGAEAWSVQMPTPMFGAMTVADGVVFFGLIHGEVSGLETETGDEVFYAAVNGPIGGGISVARGQVYVPYGFNFATALTLDAGVVGFKYAGTKVRRAQRRGTGFAQRPAPLAFVRGFSQRHDAPIRAAGIWAVTLLGCFGDGGVSPDKEEPMGSRSVLALAFAISAIPASLAAQVPEVEDQVGDKVDSDEPVGPAAEPVADTDPTEAEPPAAEAATSPAVPSSAPVTEPGTASGAPSQPEHHVWARRRLPVYVQLGPAGGVLYEDEGNRLTARESRRLAAGGLLLRAGAVLREHHLLGMRLAMSGRPSRAVVIDGQASNQWGGVGQVSFGPEYRYLTGAGFYFGGSLGLHAIGAGLELSADPPDPDCRGVECNDVEGRGALGAALTASVGYELRVTPWFAMTMELYGGMQAAVDDEDRDMDTATLGVAFGAGL